MRKELANADPGCEHEILLIAFGCTVATLVGPLIVSTVVWSVTGNADLMSWFFWGGLLLGFLAVLTAALKPRKVMLVQQLHVKPPLPTVLTWNAPGTYLSRTETTVDLNTGMFALHVVRCTDVERTWNVPGQCIRACTPTNQITEITQD